MSSFEIHGGKRLNGTIRPQGAKNEALQILCAVLLTPEKVTVSNVPDIRDVNFLIDLLRDMGVSVNKTAPETFEFQADQINLEYLRTPQFKQKAASLRGSVMILGPLLSRFRKGYIPHPGGDKIGRRRLDTHFIGLQNLGARFIFNEKEKLYEVEAEDLKGCYMLLDEASVTGTANIIMAAVMAKGK
nr:UDP-N-acetylglucosamine 1-carboxyvinyltransferase [Bacteroidales bacterium]